MYLGSNFDFNSSIVLRTSGLVCTNSFLSTSAGPAPYASLGLALAAAAGSNSLAVTLPCNWSEPTVLEPTADALPPTPNGSRGCSGNDERWAIRA